MERNTSSLHRTLSDIKHAGVFTGNRAKPIHRWYPYIEGYSADLVEWALELSELKNPRILDPFGGSGTTNLVAAQHQLDSWFCEVNPFMAWVADVKINVSRLIKSKDDLTGLLEFKKALRKKNLVSQKSLRYQTILEGDSRRHYFPDGVARQIASALTWIDDNLENENRELARLAIAVSLVPSSSMVRRTDLRRRTSTDPVPQPFVETVSTSIRKIADDLPSQPVSWSATANFLAPDIRTLPPKCGRFDLIVTSPPYLNGTNYCRNTKLELLALEFISSEAGLSSFRTESITAGINSVSKSRNPPRPLDHVEPIASKLDRCAYDKRLPQLVRLYFSDMTEALGRLRTVASEQSQLVLDIGDSKFSGVHIPTDVLLARCAEAVGWRVAESFIVRKRRSYDGSDLKQVVMRMMPE